jgi:uncharacterized protein YkwD
MLDQVRAAIRWAATVAAAAGVCFTCSSTSWGADSKPTPGFVLAFSPQQAASKPANKPQTKPQPKLKDQRKQRLIDAHNRIRKSHGKIGLKRNPLLMQMAQKWADHMAKTGIMSHQELNSAEFNGMGENCAIGSNVEEVMTAWMKSPGHKGNILDTFTHTGVGVAVGKRGQTFWCVDFGRLE